MQLPKNVKLDDNARQLLGLDEFPVIEDGGFKLKLPVNMIPGGMVTGLKATVQSDTDVAADIEAQADAVRDVIKDAMKGVRLDLKAALDKALKSAVWGWIDGARDIYDTGELLNSGQVIVSGTQIAVSYSAPYASIVHDGGYIFPYGNKKARPIYLPGRPWIASTLYGGGPVPQFDFKASLMRHLGPM